MANKEGGLEYRALVPLPGAARAQLTLPSLPSSSASLWGNLSLVSVPPAWRPWLAGPPLLGWRWGQLLPSPPDTAAGRCMRGLLAWGQGAQPLVLHHVRPRVTL